MPGKGLCGMFVVWYALIVPSPAVGQEDPALRALAERYWDATMERYPTRATALGDHRFNDRLADVSDPGRREWEATLGVLLRDVRGLSRKTPSSGGVEPVSNRLKIGATRGRALSASDRLTRDLLQRAIADELLRMQCRQHYTPLDPLDGPHVSLPLILVSQPFRNIEDFRAYAARLRAFPDQVRDMIASMRLGTQIGLVSPRVLVEKVIPQIRTHIAREVTNSEFYTPLHEASKLKEADRTTVVAEITEAIESYVIPAYLQLLAFVEDEYLHRCRSTVGIGSVPNGGKLYETLAYLNTSVRLSPEEIRRVGLFEVERIRGELGKVQKEIGFVGTLEEFVKHMGSDPGQRFGSGEELIQAARAILKRTGPLMPRLFGRLPKADCVMKEIESFRAASAPMAYYNAPPTDGSRPGYYYINTYAPKQRLRFTLEALTYHEAIPGHHLQIALHSENSALPKFRRHTYYNAYGEGWALYAEKLGYEIGGYQDPYSKFGQLIFEMWRACRLVVDTGLHIEGWSRQEAIDYLAVNTGFTALDVEAEVDRYISWPGQALSYKIGELRIMQLRREAEEQLKDRFDLRAFHDALLAEGAMPLNMLEQRMGEWLALQTK